MAMFCDVEWVDLHTFQFPVFDAIDPAASLSVTPSDDGIEPANSESNNGDINFTDFLRFLDGYSEMQEQDKMSGPLGWYSLEGLSCYVCFLTHFSCVLCMKIS